jgi:hypothetical protein
MNRNELLPEIQDYFQNQESLGCGRHALNNFFKGTYFVKDNQIVYTDYMLNTLNPATTKIPISLQSLCRLYNIKLNYVLNTQPPENVCVDNENYLIEVLQAALRICGYKAEISSEYDNNYLIIPNFKGYIINTGGHYISAKYKPLDNMFNIVDSIDTGNGPKGYDVSFEQLKKIHQVSHITVSFTGKFINPFDETNINTNDIPKMYDISRTNNCRFNKHVNYVKYNEKNYYLLSRGLDRPDNCVNDTEILDEEGKIIKITQKDQTKLTLTTTTISQKLLQAVKNYYNGKTQTSPSSPSSPSYSSSSSPKKVDKKQSSIKNSLCKIYYEDWNNLFTPGYKSELNDYLESIRDQSEPLTENDRQNMLTKLGQFCQSNSQAPVAQVIAQGLQGATPAQTRSATPIPAQGSQANIPASNLFKGISAADMLSNYNSNPDTTYYDIRGFEKKITCLKGINPCNNVNDLRLCNKNGNCSKTKYTNYELSEGPLPAPVAVAASAKGGSKTRKNIKINKKNTIKIIRKIFKIKNKTKRINNRKSRKTT